MHTKFWFEISREMINWKRETWNSGKIQYEGFYWVHLSQVGICWRNFGKKLMNHKRFS